MKELKRRGAAIEEKFPGVYYVTGLTVFDTQVVVTGQLSRERHSSLRILSRRAQEEDIRRFLDESAELTTPGDRENVSAVMEVSVPANQPVYGNFKEDMRMCEALQKLFEEEINEKVANGKAEGRAEGEAKGRAEGKAEGRAEGIIETGYDFGLSDSDILERLQAKLHVTLQQAQEYLVRYGQQKA
jgi:flagellar biosynthesis/type III secretory pathway protein FliH